jgi:hypothetical protein
MPRMRTLLLALALLATAPAYAQDQDSPKPDRWHNLILDQSTPDDAIKELGTPANDKSGHLRVYNVGRAASDRLNKEETRQLTFKNVAGMKKVELTFIGDKLLLIQLNLEKGISANAISNIYGLTFQPKVSGLDESFSPQDYERNQGRVYPKTYPSVYQLIAVTERVRVDALVSNVSLGAALKGSMGVRDDTGSFPGKIDFIQLISRKMDNRQGADVLK